jgi:small redox-active disulfide protein 2
MKTRLQILGTGCPKCRMLTEHTEKAAQALGLDYEIEKVTDLDRIFEHGVVATPALVVDGEVKVSGRVPTARRLEEILASRGGAGS